MAPVCCRSFKEAQELKSTAITTTAFSAVAHCWWSSFSARKVGFTPPQGWQATNPSIVRLGDQLALVQRCVNYTLTDGGEYRTADGLPIATRNFLLRLNPDLRVGAVVEILPPRTCRYLNSNSSRGSRICDRSSGVADFGAVPGFAN